MYKCIGWTNQNRECFSVYSKIDTGEYIVCGQNTKGLEDWLICELAKIGAGALQLKFALELKARNEAIKAGLLKQTKIGERKKQSGWARDVYTDEWIDATSPSFVIIIAFDELIAFPTAKSNIAFKRNVEQHMFKVTEHIVCFLPTPFEVLEEGSEIKEIKTYSFELLPTQLLLKKSKKKKENENKEDETLPDKLLKKKNKKEKVRSEVFYLALRKNKK